MDSTSPTPASTVGSTSDAAAAFEPFALTLVERFFMPMPKPEFAAEDERTRRWADSAPGWHGTSEHAAVGTPT